MPFVKLDVAEKSSAKTVIKKFLSIEKLLMKIVRFFEMIEFVRIKKMVWWKVFFNHFWAIEINLSQLRSD